MACTALPFRGFLTDLNHPLAFFVLQPSRICVCTTRELRLGGFELTGVWGCRCAYVCLPKGVVDACAGVCDGLRAAARLGRLSGPSHWQTILKKYSRFWDLHCLRPTLLSGICRIACRAADYGADFGWCDAAAAGTPTRVCLLSTQVIIAA